MAVLNMPNVVGGVGHTTLGGKGMAILLLLFLCPKENSRKERATQPIFMVYVGLGYGAFGVR